MHPAVVTNMADPSRRENSFTWFEHSAVANSFQTLLVLCRPEGCYHEMVSSRRKVNFFFARAQLEIEILIEI